ncbi:MAG: segregation/condensation protein A [Sedimentisphaerales bacterium]|nr:segregation/condensation protein A [Sedimentisphaerales bacterium]
MADYRVNLDIFAGPLDLLLYLVRKEEVDIYDIPIARITDQYIRYIEMLKSFDIDLAGDFLVMAATLMQIKSAMLLPQAEPEMMGEEDFSDPRAELIRQLLEYKKYKDAANLLNAAADEHKQRFARPDSIIDMLSGQSEPEVDIEQISIWDLLEAFDSVCRATGTAVDVRHIEDDTPIDLYQIEILHRLQSEGQLTFEQIFERGSGRLVMVGLFLGLLELVRSKLVSAEQTASVSTIYLRALTDEPPEQAVQNAIIAVTEADDDRNTAESQEPGKPAIPVSQVSYEGQKGISMQISHDSAIPIAEYSSEAGQPALEEHKAATQAEPDVSANGEGQD